MLSSNVNTICRFVFGGIVIITMAGLQIYAWHTGHNGVVFASTTGIIGAISGALLGFDLGLKKAK